MKSSCEIRQLSYLSAYYKILADELQGGERMYKLLIAEDIEITRNMLINSIKWKEIDVEIIGIAANGKEAIEIIEKQCPDLIITDIKMPILDGFQLINLIQQKGIRIETIILSAYGDFNYAQNAIRVGVVDYVLKPVDINELCIAVKKAIVRIEEREQKEKYNRIIDDIIRDRFPNLKLNEESIVQDSNLKNRKIVEKTIEIIKKNIDKNISVEDIAAEVFLNAKYLNTIFKHIMGESISKYLIKSKLIIAAELLRDPSIKIYEVCDRIGYTDQNYFRDIFTKHFGVTPSEYRKKVL